MQTKYAYWVFRNKISKKDRKKIRGIAVKSGYRSATIKEGYLKDLDSKNFSGNVRKVSLVACLSNGYVGGDLELALQRQDEPNEILYPKMECGDVIVFPSYVYHRSTEITEGTKYSLAMWALGPPFK